MVYNKIILSINNAFTKVVSLVLKGIKRILPKRFSSYINKVESNTAFHNIIGLLFFNAIGGLLMILTQVKLANYLGAYIYGIYAYVLAIGEIGANFVRYGRHKTMVRELVRFPKLQNDIISNTFVLSLINILIFLSLILIIHRYIEIDLSVTILLLIISPCFISLDFQPVYEKLKMMSWHSIYNLLQKAFFLIPIWIGILFSDKLSLTYIAIVTCISWTIVLIWQYKEISRIYSLSIFSRVNKRSLIQQYKDNALITICCFAGIAFGPIIRMILKHNADASEVGIFSAGFQLLILSQFILNQISRIGNPKMAEVCLPGYSFKLRQKFIKKYCVVMFLSVLPFTIALSVFSSEIVTHFYAQEYARIAEILPIFGFYLMVCSQGVVFNQYMISFKNDKAYFTIYISSAILSFIIAILLIPIFGLVGAAWAYCIADGMASILYFSYFFFQSKKHAIN